MIYMNLFFFSLLLLGLMYKYMLVMLMLVELVIVNMAVLMFSIYMMMSMEFFMIFYLVFSVCESVMGLSLLVLVIRYHGNDLYYSFYMSKF